VDEPVKILFAGVTVEPSIPMNSNPSPLSADIPVEPVITSNSPARFVADETDSKPPLLCFNLCHYFSPFV
jgi:hypothetical protein